MSERKHPNVKPVRPVICDDCGSERVKNGTCEACGSTELRPAF